MDLGVVLHHDVGRNGQVVGLDLLALPVDDLDDGVLGLVLRLDDHLLRQTRLLVALLAVGDALDDVLVGGLALELRDDDRIVGIPLADQVALLHLGAVGHEERGAVRQRMRIEYDLGLGIDDADLRLA